MCLGGWAKGKKMNEWKYKQEIFVSLTQGRGMVLLSNVVQYGVPKQMEIGTVRT